MHALEKRVYLSLCFKSDFYRKDLIQRNKLFLTKYNKKLLLLSAADIKMGMPVLALSLKSSILSSTSSQLDDTFWGVVNAAV